MFGMLYRRTMILLALIFAGSSVEAPAANLENILYLDLDWGRVVIELRPDIAPNHVKQIKTLVRAGFYDGVRFHRVIPGFMAQTGDPLTRDETQRNRWGTGGSDQNIDAEFSQTPHVRGTVSMARSSDPNSASSQFFIVTAPSRFLDAQYTVWGRVIEGMDHVDKIASSEKQSGLVDNPSQIKCMMIASGGKCS